MPADMYMSEIPMIKRADAANHMLRNRYSSEEIKIITTKVKAKEGFSSNNNILLNALCLGPVYETWVDMRNKKIINSFQLSDKQIRYKNIPEPVF